MQHAPVTLGDGAREAELLDRRRTVVLRQQTDHDVLVVQRRLGLHAQVEHLAADAPAHAPALWHAALGDVEVAGELDDVDDLRHVGGRELVAADVAQAAVDAEPQTRPRVVDLEVDVAGAFGHGVEQQRLEHACRARVFDGRDVGRRRLPARLLRLLGFGRDEAEFDRGPDALQIGRRRQLGDHTRAVEDAAQFPHGQLEVASHDHDLALAAADRHETVVVEVLARQLPHQLTIEAVQHARGVGEGEVALRRQGAEQIVLADRPTAQQFLAEQVPRLRRGTRRLGDLLAQHVAGLDQHVAQQRLERGQIQLVLDEGAVFGAQHAQQTPGRHAVVERQHRGAAGDQHRGEFDRQVTAGRLREQDRVVFPATGAVLGQERPQVDVADAGAAELLGELASAPGDRCDDLDAGGDRAADRRQEAADRIDDEHADARAHAQVLEHARQRVARQVAPGVGQRRKRVARHRGQRGGDLRVARHTGRHRRGRRARLGLGGAGHVQDIVSPQPAGQPAREAAMPWRQPRSWAFAETARGGSVSAP